MNTPKPYGYDLWKFFYDVHGLTLLETEIEDIRRECRKLDIEDAAPAFEKRMKEWTEDLKRSAVPMQTRPDPDPSDYEAPQSCPLPTNPLPTADEVQSAVHPESKSSPLPS